MEPSVSRYGRRGRARAIGGWLVLFGALSGCASDETGSQPLPADTGFDVGTQVVTDVVTDAVADVVPDSAADSATGDSMVDSVADTSEGPVPFGVHHMDLRLDVTALTGRATITLAFPGPALRVDGLTVTDVTRMGQPIEWSVTDGALVVAEPTGSAGATDTTTIDTITIDYGFQTHPVGEFEGLMERGSTLLWPYFCVNLYPCNPAPDDGFTWTLAVDGVPEGSVAIHADSVAVETPGYMLALAFGDYAYVPIGATTAGTEVGYWTLPETAESASSGTANLVGIFDWFEQTLGDYTLGSPVGPVAVDWGLFAAGGIEHHPRWHVSTNAFGNEAVNAHEACHGWFGSGILLECWEDLLLSEGVCDYLAARAISEVVGVEAGEALWTSYRNGLEGLVSLDRDAIAWPATCEADFDVIEDGLFSKIPYFKGALFLYEVGFHIGFDTLDGILGDFYLAHHNRPARFQTLLDWIALTGYDPEPAASAWLKSLGVPGAPTTR